jgi:hypothetical protein
MAITLWRLKVWRLGRRQAAAGRMARRGRLG